MKKRLPPLNWLRTFELSAQHLNFTQAAQELNLTQAAISQQIKGLESQLGVALFKRLPRGLELTEAGRAYIPIVHEAIERLVVATDELFGQNRNRDLNIRVSLVFFTSWLAPRLGKFRQQHPEVGLRFSSNIWTDQTPVDADLEIRHGLGKWSGFSCDRLSWDQLIPVCRPAYFAAAIQEQHIEASVQALSHCTLLHVLGYNEGWGHWLYKNGYPDLKPAQSMQLDSLLPALELAVQGQGVALGRTCLVQAQLDSKQLIAPFAQPLSTDEAFYLITPERQYRHANAEAFRSWLIAEAQQEQQSQNQDNQ
ncbi:MAG: LysR substrate-binding domain-containing protein [Pseudomonadales bacterium]|nr:LysR substrate-binding domain-containing protein [Pseudomonadales bacterium]